MDSVDLSLLGVATALVVVVAIVGGLLLLAAIVWAIVRDFMGLDAPHPSVRRRDKRRGGYIGDRWKRGAR